LVPQGVPGGSLPAAEQTAVPDEQSTVIFAQDPASVQSAPPAQAVHAP
jgi:hypothetical protein